MAKYLKEKTGAKIVIGGYEHTKALGKELLSKYKYIDYCITGGGEEPLLKLCNILESKGSLKNVPNLLYEAGKAMEKKAQLKTN